MLPYLILVFYFNLKMFFLQNKGRNKSRKNSQLEAKLTSFGVTGSSAPHDINTSWHQHLMTSTPHDTNATWHTPRSETILFLFWNNLVFVFLFILKLQFFSNKKRQKNKYQHLQNLTFCLKVNLKVEGSIMSSIILDFLQTKFCKHLHLVISQLLDKIFQPFKEQKWCPSRISDKFWVSCSITPNSEQNYEFRSH